MSIIKIDNKEYELDNLSTDAKAQLGMLQFVDAELQRIVYCTMRGTCRASRFDERQQ